MKMKFITYIYLNIIFNLFEMYPSQYIMPRLPKSNACDNPRSTALVEQFFNLIFTEFQNPPPVCVCVQMCLEQAAYCYPNGCLKRLDKRNEGSTMKPVNRIQYGTTQSLMFVVDKDPDFDDIFEVTSLKSNADKGQINQLNEIIYNSNPFSELVLKYKRLPKMEMKYNLRERVKNSKSAKIKRDKLDMLNTKWPLHRHFGRKQLLNNLYQKNEIKRRDFIISTKPGVETVIDSPTHYKRLKTKREDTANMDELYLYQADNSSLSLETLIDTLILSSLHKNSENEDTTLTTIDDTTVLESLINAKANLNDTAKYINHTNANITIRDDKVLNNTTNNHYGELITTLSKEIDKNNDKSIKIAKQIIGTRQAFVSKQKVEETTECCVTLQSNENSGSTDFNTLKDSFNNNILLQSTKNFYPLLRNSFKKSSNKRIVRKLL